jgi:hypothetical protein
MLRHLDSVVVVSRTILKNGGRSKNKNGWPCRCVCARVCLCSAVYGEHKTKSQEYDGGRRLGLYSEFSFQFSEYIGKGRVFNCFLFTKSIVER